MENISKGLLLGKGSVSQMQIRRVTYLPPVILCSFFSAVFDLPSAVALNICLPGTRVSDACSALPWLPRGESDATSDLEDETCVLHLGPIRQPSQPQFGSCLPSSFRVTAGQRNTHPPEGTRV